MNQRDPREQLDAFGRAYDYDVTYLHDLLSASPGGFETFVPVQGMSSFRSSLPLDAHFVARITTVQTEDCGPCGQLNLRMAVEAGVPKTLLSTLIERPEELPAPLADVRAHTRCVVGVDPPDAERRERLRERYGESGLAELALCITGARIYPTLKRGMDHGQSCEKLSLDFA